MLCIDTRSRCLDLFFDKLCLTSSVLKKPSEIWHFYSNNKVSGKKSHQNDLFRGMSSIPMLLFKWQGRSRAFCPSCAEVDLIYFLGCWVVLLLCTLKPLNLSFGWKLILVILIISCFWCSKSCCRQIRLNNFLIIDRSKRHSSLVNSMIVVKYFVMSRHSDSWRIIYSFPSLNRMSQHWIFNQPKSAWSNKSSTNTF